LSRVVAARRVTLLAEAALAAFALVQAWLSVLELRTQSLLVVAGLVVLLA
jgi:hypothetical protein